MNYCIKTDTTGIFQTNSGENIAPDCQARWRPQHAFRFPLLRDSERVGKFVVSRHAGQGCRLATLTAWRAARSAGYVSTRAPEADRYGKITGPFRKKCVARLPCQLNLAQLSSKNLSYTHLGYGQQATLRLFPDGNAEGAAFDRFTGGGIGLGLA